MPNKKNKIIKKDSGTHLIVEYAGMFAGHVVTVTIACKAHIHISSCQWGGQKYWVYFMEKNEKKPVRQQRTTDRIKLQLAKQQGSNCLCPHSQACMNNAAISHEQSFSGGREGWGCMRQEGCRVFWCCWAFLECQKNLSREIKPRSNP